MNVDLKSLIARLNSVSREALEDAARFCASNGHAEIEVEHVLLKLLDQEDSDFIRILAHFSINRDRLATDLSNTVQKTSR